jgi:hypothetical protein
VHDEEFVRSPDAAKHGFLIPRRNRAKIDELDRNPDSAQRLGRLKALRDGIAVGDEREVVAMREDAGTPGQHEMIGCIGRRAAIREVEGALGIKNDCGPR